MPKRKPKPKPGSDEAILKGCTCPVLDNGHGKGYLGGMKDRKGKVIYVINAECPLHGSKDVLTSYTL